MATIDYKQGGRELAVSTPLGPDVLLLRRFDGREEISGLFRFELELFSEDDAIAPGRVVGKPIAWRVEFVDAAPRLFHGVVSRFAAGGRDVRGLRTYRAEVVPWLWFLTRTTDCRIFQNRSVPEIVTSLFDEFGFADYEPSLKGHHPRREYCVQYRETDFDFVSRLMEEEGIFYFFRHEDGKHTMVVADHNGPFAERPEVAAVYDPGSVALDHVDRWERRFEFRPGRWAQTDYNFEAPSTPLLTDTETLVDLPDARKFERFDYPGGYGQTARGRELTKLRMEEEEAAHDEIDGAGRYCSFTAGGAIALRGHDVAGEDGTYVLTSVTHAAADASHENSAGGTDYRNTFTCIPASVAFRPARRTPRPVVRGVQTAVVVGPAGEEIYTDKYGRVKVQFFWDRRGKHDEDSSCWIRVAENWAGNQWGIVFHPRIGQEVVVDFLDGDPDRPLITGRVYNAQQMPPYDLPANQTRSTIKTRSTKGGDAETFNELRFEDRKGGEQVYFHAEKDFDRVVENNDTLRVGFDKKDKGDQTIEVFNNQSLTVGAGKAGAAEGSQTINVYKDRAATLETGNDTLEVKRGDRGVTIVMGNDSLSIKMGNQVTKLDLGKSETEAMQSITLKVGQSSLVVDQMGVTIKGLMIKVEGTVQTEVSGLMTSVKADAMLTAKGGIVMIG